MSKPLFTPGPWLAREYAVGSPLINIRSAADDEPIASAAWMPDTGMERMRANASLIAAAPDLYEALIAMLRAYGNEAEEAAAHRAAESALAKVRGDA